MQPSNLGPMCTCTFRYPVEYDKAMKKIFRQWEFNVGPTSFAQIKRLIFYRGLQSFVDEEGKIDI
ncbi:unnamed protein product [marine sediment metagenome]|uniref:Uncharacterized protein n=1 Tax=marine sediment metagenome TaxID=412755 RepID=X1EU24_9ZZZZ